MFTSTLQTLGIAWSLVKVILASISKNARGSSVFLAHRLQLERLVTVMFDEFLEKAISTEVLEFLDNCIFEPKEFLDSNVKQCATSNATNKLHAR